jgi:hypothetical protein
VVLAVLSIVGFVLSGLGALGVPGLEAAWPAITVASAAVSLLLVVLFWHLYFIVGLALDIALLATTLGGWWPSTIVR